MAVASTETFPDEDTTGEFVSLSARRPPVVRISADAVTHPGIVRTNNEDQFLVAKLAKSMRVCRSSLPEDDNPTHFSDEEGHLFIVADGMGGVAAGERASALAVRTVEEFVLNTVKWFLHFGQQEENVLVGELRQAIERADRNVIRQAQADPTLHGMGTTLTMAYSVGADLYVIHAGDSRAYLFRDGELSRITSDHTLVQLLVDSGTITPEAARHHHRRNVVTNVVGGPREGVQAEIRKVALADGDTILLCSDGLTEPVTDDRIAEILARHGEPQAACGALVEAALAGGGPDNVTAIVASYRIEAQS